MEKSFDAIVSNKVGYLNAIKLFNFLFSRVCVKICARKGNLKKENNDKNNNKSTVKDENRIVN